MTKPQKIFNIWIFGTLFLFYCGPLKYECNKILAVGYIVLFMFFANLFYYIGIHVRIKNPYPRKKIRHSTEWIIKMSIYYSFFITLACVIESSMKYGFSGFSFSTIISKMANSYSFQNDYVFMVSIWILSYTKWIRVIGLVLGSLFWFKINKKQRVLYLATCLLIIIYNTLFLGSQKELIDLVIYMFLPILIRWSKEDKKMKIWKVLLTVVFICAACIFLGSVINARHELWKEMFNSNASTGADYSNWIYKILPNSIADPITYLLSYLTQGYRGLALCLTLPFKWAYGMGSSFKIMNDISRWLSIPLSRLEVSYPVRMEAIYHVGAYASWHSIFPWIASDFTFLGAIIIVSIFIYYWAKSWKEFLKCGSWISAVMFIQLTIFVLYIPCNNQLFQTRDSIISTLAIFILWYWYHGTKHVNITSEVNL